MMKNDQGKKRSENVYDVSIIACFGSEIAIVSGCVLNWNIYFMMILAAISGLAFFLVELLE